MADADDQSRAVITSLQLRAYRHFRDATLRIEPHATVLVGGNDVGKTTLLGALNELRRVLGEGPRGGAARGLGRECELRVEFDLRGQRRLYAVAFGEGGGTERLWLTGTDEPPTWEWIPSHRRLKGRGGVSEQVEAEWSKSGLLSLMSGAIAGEVERVGGEGWMGAAVQALNALRAALPRPRHLHPALLALPVAGVSDEVSTDGVGFAAAMQRVVNRRDGSVEAVEGALAPLFPHLGRIRVQPRSPGDGPGLEVSFLLRTSSEEIEVPASRSSAGLLLALAHLTLSYDEERGTMLALEEPENGLNARIMLQLMRAFLDATHGRGQQVILTTHNGWWLDVVPPEAIRVVSRDADGGHVHVPNVAALEKAREKHDAYPSEIFAVFGAEGLLEGRLAP